MRHASTLTICTLVTLTSCAYRENNTNPSECSFGPLRGAPKVGLRATGSPSPPIIGEYRSYAPFAAFILTLRSDGHFTVEHEFLADRPVTVPPRREQWKYGIWKFDGHILHFP